MHRNEGSPCPRGSSRSELEKSHASSVPSKAHERPFKSRVNEVHRGMRGGVAFLCRVGFSGLSGPRLTLAGIKGCSFRWFMFYDFMSIDLNLLFICMNFDMI